MTSNSNGSPLSKSSLTVVFISTCRLIRRFSRSIPVFYFTPTTITILLILLIFLTSQNGSEPDTVLCFGTKSCSAASSSSYGLRNRTSARNGSPFSQNVQHVAPRARGSQRVSRGGLEEWLDPRIEKPGWSAYSFRAKEKWRITTLCRLPET